MEVPCDVEPKRLGRSLQVVEAQMVFQTEETAKLKCNSGGSLGIGFVRSTEGSWSCRSRKGTWLKSWDGRSQSGAGKAMTIKQKECGLCREDAKEPMQRLEDHFKHFNTRGNR